MRPRTQLGKRRLETHAKAASALRSARRIPVKAQKTGTARLSHAVFIPSALLVVAPFGAETASLQGEALACRARRSAPPTIQTRFVHHGVFHA
jgi:hypothetical protein